MSVYSHFGPGVVNKLSDVISEELQRQDLCTLPEGQLLRIFNVLVDCGINAFHLWETTMQGDVLSPNFDEKSCMNVFILSAAIFCAFRVMSYISSVTLVSKPDINLFFITLYSCSISA